MSSKLSVSDETVEAALVGYFGKGGAKIAKHDGASDRMRRALEAALAASGTEIERLQDIIDRQRQAAAKWREILTNGLARWEWIAEGRGSYEWDDDEYRREFGRCMKSLRADFDKAAEEMHAYDLTDTPRRAEPKRDQIEPVLRLLLTLEAQAGWHGHEGVAELRELLFRAAKCSYCGGIGSQMYGDSLAPKPCRVCGGTGLPEPAAQEPTCKHEGEVGPHPLNDAPLIEPTSAPGRRVRQWCPGPSAPSETKPNDRLREAFERHDREAKSVPEPLCQQPIYTQAGRAKCLRPRWAHNGVGHDFQEDPLREGQVSPGRYKSGEVPQVGDRIYAGDEYRTEDFITLVRTVRGDHLTTAGWPEAGFPVAYCTLVERGPVT